MPDAERSEIGARAQPMAERFCRAIAGVVEGRLRLSRRARGGAFHGRLGLTVIDTGALQWIPRLGQRQWRRGLITLPGGNFAGGGACPATPQRAKATALGSAEHGAGMQFSSGCWWRSCSCTPPARQQSPAAGERFPRRRRRPAMRLGPRSLIASPATVPHGAVLAGLGYSAWPRHGPPFWPCRSRPGLHHPYWRDVQEVLDLGDAGAISVIPRTTRSRLMGLLTYGGIFWLALHLGWPSAGTLRSCSPWRGAASSTPPMASSRHSVPRPASRASSSIAAPTRAMPA